MSRAMQKHDFVKVHNEIQWRRQAYDLQFGENGVKCDHSDSLVLPSQLSGIPWQKYIHAPRKLKDEQFLQTI